MSAETVTEAFRISRRSLLGGLLIALAAAPAAVVAPSSAEAQERQFARPSHAPRVQRPRSALRGPGRHRRMFRVRRRFRAIPHGAH
jgi:hypothetical protein